MDETLSPSDRAKRAAAAEALTHVEAGMRLGLGTGSTADWLVRLLAERVAAGLTLRCCATSSRTTALAEELGVSIEPLDALAPLDLVIDGADEADPALNLIKGAGGALLQEKIVADAASRMIVIADDSKVVERLGAFALPVEIIRFGAGVTRLRIEEALAEADVDGREITPRMAGDEPYVTDEGHFILDLHLGRIGAPAALSERLLRIPGVVETGLFLGMADTLILGRPDGAAETRRAA